MMLPLLVLPGLPAQASARTPYAMHDPLRLGAFALPESVPRFGLVEAEIDAAGAYDDPFDPAEVRLDATVTPPDGRAFSVPGYLDRPYRRTLADGKEVLEPTGPPRWRLRLCPEAEGTYHVRVVFADRTGEKAQNATFRCVASDDRGFVRLGEEDRRYFAFSKGPSYWPLGASLADAGPRGTFALDDSLDGLGAHGADYVRLTIAPGTATLSQETPGRPEEGKGIGQVDLAAAWRLDHVLTVARAKGIYATLVLDDGDELRQGTRGGWDRAAQNSDNGGPLRIWRDFWSSDKMDRLYRNRLRYLVARYGADTHLFAWEFWNEVDQATEFDAATARDWHQRMARALDGLDAYRHLRTTSVRSTLGLRSIDTIPELDFMQTHATNAADPAVVAAAQQSRKSGWGKAHLVGLVAEDGEDPEGLRGHDPLWASLATGASGGAVAADGATLPPRVFDAAARFLEGVDWGRERFRQTDVALSPANPRATLPPGDLVFDDGPLPFVSGPAAKPQMAVISGGVLMGTTPAGILHGIVMHPELHNPLMLRVRVATATRFEVSVGAVSGEGGAKLSVVVDGAEALSKEFADPDWKTKLDDLPQYAGVFPIALSPGAHTLVIDNRGVDWVKVGYRLVGVVPRTKPPINAWAVVGDGAAMAWVRPADRTYRAVAAEKRAIPPAPASVLRLRGLRSGTWRTEVWDTWEGKPIQTVRTKVGIDGGIRVALPALERDVAVKMVREGV